MTVKTGAAIFSTVEFSGRLPVRKSPFCFLPGISSIMLIFSWEYYGKVHKYPFYHQYHREYVVCLMNPANILSKCGLKTAPKVTVSRWLQA